MTFRLGVSRNWIGRGASAAVSVLALLCAAGAASPLFTPLPSPQGQPVFSATPTSIPVGGAPSSIATGDLNGDGWPDIATANAGSQDITLLLNDGRGHFTPTSLSPGGPDPSAIAIGDLRGGGHGGDVAVTYEFSNIMILFRRDDSSPSGYQRTILPTGLAPVSVAIGDLDGDGRADIAVANRQSTTVMLFMNNGNDRSFTTTTLQTAGNPMAGSGPVAVKIGDLSGHGPYDIAVADGNSNTVTLFLKNPGASGYTTKTIPAGRSATSVAIGDLGGTGPGNDLVVKNVHDNALTVLLRDPASPTGYSPKILDTGSTNSSGSKNIAIGDIHGLCLPIPSTIGLPGLPLPVLGDINQLIKRLRHCLPGLAIANRLDQSVIVFTKNETGGDFTRTTISTGAGPVAIAIGDLTGSGKLDLATANVFSNDVTLLTNTTRRIRLGG